MDPNDLGGSQNFIQNTVVTTKTPIIAGIDDFMNWLVHEGIPGACGRVAEACGNAMSKGGDYVMAKMDTPSTPSGDTVPNMSEAKLAMGQEIGKAITPDIQQLAQMSVSMPQCQIADVGNDYNLAPHHTPGLGVQMGGAGMGMSA